MNMHVFNPSDDASEAADNLPIRRATVESLVAHRNRALELYEQAHDALTAAHAILMDAQKAHHAASPGITRFNYHSQEEKRQFGEVLDLPPKDKFLAKSRKLVDTDVWAHIVQVTELQQLMDKKARDELSQQLHDNPVEVTAGNIIATLEQFMGQADMIWRRGVAECFSKLDRRFRSHDGWKIGSRVILDYMFDKNGWYNYHRDQEGTLQDIERAFCVLDGRRQTYSGIVEALRATRHHRSGAHQSYVESEFFRVRCFKNGNAHIWFKRDDLVEKVNQILGEYYGAPIPEERDPDPADPFKDIKTTPAKNYGFFPTPDDVVSYVLDGVPLLRGVDEEPLRILEPSAGTGNLARRCIQTINILDEWSGGRERHAASYRFDNRVDCVEIQPHLADALEAEGIYGRVYTQDFLTLSPETTGLYDRVVMNPPFDRERDIDHVMHALKFLKPDGILVAIMSAGTEFRETRKSEAFRELMQKMNASWNDLPPASFASVGTYCNTIRLRVRKDGRGHWYR